MKDIWQIRNFVLRLRFRLRCSLVCVLVVLLDVTSAMAAIKVIPDRASPQLNESFRLTFEADEQADGDPDFSPLEEHFEILGRSQRSNISITNGTIKKSTVWILNLMPKQAGVQVIPSIRFGSDQSPAQKIEIADSGARGKSVAKPNDDMFVEFEVEPREPYVQQQIIYTVRLVREPDLEVNNASLSEPKLHDSTAIVQQLGKDKIFHGNRGGKRMLIVERIYAVFPQQSGATSIDPVVFNGNIVRGTASLFDPFGQNVMTKRLETESVNINVKAIPSGFHGRQWLPAKSLQLSEIWSKDPLQFKENEPLTRTLALVAGGLTAGQLPELNATPNDAFKAYPEQPGLEDQKKMTGVSGIRRQKVVLIPVRPGQVVLPAVVIPWWNTDTDKAELAQLPQRVVEVEGAKASDSPTPTPAAISKATTVPNAAPEIAAGKESTIDTGDSGWNAQTALATGLLAGWLSAFLAYRIWHLRYKQNVIGTVVTRSPRRSEAELAKAVVRAAEANDAIAAQRALIAWARVHWQSKPPLSLGALVQCSGGEFGDSVKELAAVLYSPSDSAWIGDLLAQTFKRYLREPLKTTAPDHSSEGLEPLFKI